MKINIKMNSQLPITDKNKIKKVYSMDNKPIEKIKKNSSLSHKNKNPT